MSIKQKTIDLHKRMELAQSGGGEKAIEKQLALGKLLARDRILAIVDPGTFHEYDLFVEHQAREGEHPVARGAWEQPIQGKRRRHEEPQEGRRRERHAWPPATGSGVWSGLGEVTSRAVTRAVGRDRSPETIAPDLAVYRESRIAR